MHNHNIKFLLKYFEYFFHLAQKHTHQILLLLLVTCIQLQKKKKKSMSLVRMRHHEKTRFLPMRKQRRRSAVQ